MRQFLVLPTLLFTGLFLTVRCTHEPLNPINPNPIDSTGLGGNCDPDTVYLQQEVLPLIVSSCAMSGCHDAASAQNGVVLTSYSTIMNTGDVKAGQPNNSELACSLRTSCSGMATSTSTSSCNRASGSRTEKSG